ncbi:hypothetical protein DPMN_052889 [Dreissena polymorpha]|uniref:Uncharacterized protein n=2 Tax=Dreissena polymorpha TaxID=45954 RepID=A0A9D4CM08_DREPO|nr:hypothetical protein DPMN_052889 [Dreissena polymorpha]
MLDFVKDIVKLGNINSDDVRVGVVLYSTEVEIQFYLNQYTTEADVIAAIDKIPYIYGSTNTADAMFVTSRGDRPEVDNVAIVLTDGVSNINSRRTIPESEAARNKGIEVYVVEGMASIPKTKYLYNWFRSYLSDRTQSVHVNDARSDFRSAVCGVPPGTIDAFEANVNELCFTAPDLPPVANAGSDIERRFPVALITLDGRASTDDKAVVKYTWTLQDGTRLRTWSTATVNLDDQPVGVYTFTLTVEDEKGQSDDDTVKVTVMASSEEDIQCDPPWERVHRSCLRFNTTNFRSWMEARKECKTLGAYLLVIRDASEFDALQKPLKSKITSQRLLKWWVGLELRKENLDEEIRSSWTWIDGTSHIRGLPHWAPGEPNGARSTSIAEDCVALDYQTYIRDDDCKRSLPYICEKNRLSPEPITDSPTTTTTSTSTSTDSPVSTPIITAKTTSISTSTDDQNNANRETSPSPVQCLPDTDFNGIEWATADAGEVKEKNCTDGYIGMKTRTCNASGHYENPTYNCTKQAIHAILNKVKNNVSADMKETIDDLRKEISFENNNTSEKTTLHVGDIETATEIMKLITDRFEAHNSSIENVTDSFVDVVDNLISDRTTHSWGALLDKGGAATVINVLDEFISKVVNNSAVSKQNMTVRKDNIFLEIGSVAQCSKIKFPNGGKNGNVPDWAMTRHDSVEVACRGSGGLTFSGSLFRNMSSIMSSKTKCSRHMEINAPVLAFSVHDSITASDAQNVTLVFELFNTDLAKPSCSFWEKGNSSGEGFWSSEGCKLVEYNHQTGLVTCSCNHLTNFAVLMSPGVTVEKIHHQTLSAITVVGCCLSLAGLVTSSVIYVYCWRMVKSNRATLLLNLCAALFVAYLAFLIGIKRTQTTGACTFTAVLLHYVYLVAFFLMLAEGGVIALMVLSPLTKRDNVPYFFAGAYGFPAIIVGVSMVATQLDGYGNDRFCWLSVESGLFWAFAGPVLAIVVTNLIILVLVLKQLFGVAAMSKKTDAEKVKTGVRSVCILLPVMGLTWVFGIFAVNKDTLVFQYLFAIFNSLQGFLIFLVQCVFDRKVRDALRQRKLPWFTSTDVRTGDTEMGSTQKSS